MQEAFWLFTLLASITAALLVLIAGLVARRWWLARAEQRRTLHLRLIKSELLQLVARGEGEYIVEHWSKHDRAVAFEVAAQLLALIRGRDRQRLLDVVVTNMVLAKPLAMINRFGVAKRIATIKQLSPFDIPVVQNTLQSLMLHSDRLEVRVEAALALTRGGKMPSPWQIVGALCADNQPLTPAHRELFRSMMPVHQEAFVAMALMQDNLNARILAIDALGFSADYRVIADLSELAEDERPAIRGEAVRAAIRIGHPIALKWVGKLCDDPDSAVRYQAMCAVDELSAKAGEAQEDDKDRQLDDCSVTAFPVGRRAA